jgi:hypothetical protein
VIATPRWAFRRDHYYWLTAFLAARDAQTTTCRTIAATVGVLGVLPLAMMATPFGALGSSDRLVVVVAAGCGLVMALIWL